MKKAVIDQIMLWMFIFVSFVIIFFMVIDYYSVLKTKDRCDTMSSYAVRMIALGKNISDITDELNKRISSSMVPIISSDIVCIEDSSVSTYQVVFHINMEINTTTFKDKSINSYSSAFNESNSSSVDCNLTINTQ